MTSGQAVACFVEGSEKPLCLRHLRRRDMGLELAAGTYSDPIPILFVLFKLGRNA